jgi:hypothetical protein
MSAIKLQKISLTFGTISLVLLFIMACSGASQKPSMPVKSAAGTETTFVLVRHAERAKEPGESALRPEGRVRAQALANALENRGVTAIYSPDRGRNRETVEPLAKRLGLSVNLIPEKQLANTKVFADQFVNTVLSEHAGGTVVWVGNKSPVGIWGGNLKEIYKRLGATGDAPSKYDDLFIIVVTDAGALKVSKTTYGEKAGRFDQ